MILANWTPHGWPTGKKPDAPRPVDLKKRYVRPWDINYTIGFKKPPVPQFVAGDNTTQQESHSG